VIELTKEKQVSLLLSTSCIAAVRCQYIADMNFHYALNGLARDDVFDSYFQNVSSASGA